MDEYEPIFNKWIEDFEDYMAAYQAVVSESKAFLFNCALHLARTAKVSYKHGKCRRRYLDGKEKKQRRVLAALSDVEQSPVSMTNPKRKPNKARPFVIDVDDSSLDLQL